MHRRLPTQNRTGWASNQLNEVSERFVAHCRFVTRPVLDIGAAFGLASLAAIESGATVYANDLDPSHLAQIPPSEKLILLPGRVPHDLHFPENSLDAVHASNIFHFLTGPQLARGLKSIAHWLAPGGKLFVQAATPWQKPFESFIPVFESRRAAGVEWPGWIEKTTDYSTHRKLGQIPSSIHLLDDKTLQTAAETAGLTVEESTLYRRRDLPRSLFHDGRECTALLAKK
jgi:SAM-dependent methyltransferase